MNVIVHTCCSYTFHPFFVVVELITTDSKDSSTA